MSDPPEGAGPVQRWPPPEPPAAEDPLVVLARRLGHPFAEPELLRRALTHRSWAHEQDPEGLDEVVRSSHYERLEFLGDAVLGLIAAEWLFTRFPERTEGALTKLKAVIVSAPVLERRAQALGLGDVLRLGVGEERSGGRGRASILADALEAVFGAVFLDGGIGAARRVLVPILDAALDERDVFAREDAKTVLQELAQARGWPLPAYRVVAAEGPDHRKTFRVECRVGDLPPAVAEGASKKTAEQAAAALALAALAALPDAGSP